MAKVKRVYNYTSKQCEDVRADCPDSVRVRSRKQRHPTRSVPRGSADTTPGVVFKLPFYTGSSCRGTLVRVVSMERREVTTAAQGQRRLIDSLIEIAETSME